MTYYSCRRVLDENFKITKFDEDFNVVETKNGPSSYLVSEGACECPAGINHPRKKCRHREMLPLFLKLDHVGDGWFLIWATRQWINPMKGVGNE